MDFRGPTPEAADSLTNVDDVTRTLNTEGLSSSARATSARAKRARARKVGKRERGRIFGDSAESTEAGQGGTAEERVPGRAHSAGEETANAEA